MNVKFISVAGGATGGGFKAYDSSKYKGYFVHLTSEATIGNVKYPAGLYFGGESGWEYLTNDTNVAAIEQKIKDAVNALDANVAISSWNADTRKLTITGGVAETDGKVGKDGAVADVEVTFENVALTGKAADVKLNAYANGSHSSIAQDTTVQTAVQNIIKSIDDLSSASAITLVDASGQRADTVKPDGTTYQLKQGTKVVAKFNIEKDSFVKTGEVVYGTYASGSFTEGTEGNKGDAFLHLVIGNADAKETDVYIAAKDMIKQFKSGTNLLSFNGETLNATEKLTSAVTKVEGLAVNGVAVAADGKVTIDADDIAYGDINSDSASETVKAAIDDVYGKIAKLGTDAYKGVKNQNDAQYVKVGGIIDSENKQELSVQMGSFDVDLTYNEGGDKWVVNPSTNYTEGLVSASAVKEVVLANEQVTAAGLNKLNTDVKTLNHKVDTLDPYETFVAGTNDPAYTNSGVNVRVAVADAPSGNDHHYTVSATAELTWLTSLE